MLGFGMFVVALLALVVELIKNQQKNILSLVVNHDPTGL
ncbi:putative holin-like toxin [Lacticaseibacillus paracasei]|jgi:5'-deoxynucleotidase YfbR-like HD superfamily hydrolase